MFLHYKYTTSKWLVSLLGVSDASVLCLTRKARFKSISRCFGDYFAEERRICMHKHIWPLYTASTRRSIKAVIYTFYIFLKT